MRALGIVLITLLAVLFGSTFSSLIDDTSHGEDEFPCDCQYCNATEVIDLDDDDKDNESKEKIWDQEDYDDDGDMTICARDRDEEDRSFSSICHMYCHNNCTQSHVRMYKENKVKKYMASVTRTNYYKIRDGPC